jgi:acetoin utilization protein AcuB
MEGSGMLSKYTVGRFMTREPVTIGIDQPLTVAHRMMRQHRVRHLPVLAEGKLVGMVTQRDLALIETLRDVDPEKVTVEEAMTPDPYLVSPNDSLDAVARAMADHRVGSAVVVEDGHVIGIFTTVDALQALLHLVDDRRKRRGVPSHV